MTSLEIFRLIAPELSNVADIDVSAMIELGELEISEAVYKSMYEKALAYYAAHMLTVNSLTNDGVTSAYPVRSEKEGDLSRSYAISDSSGFSTYDSTKYGKELKRIGKLSVVSLVVR